MVVLSIVNACGPEAPTVTDAKRVVLNVDSLTLQQLDSAQLIPSFVDGQGTLITGVPAKFSSSDPTVASVSSIGLVKSLGAAGLATITVRGAGLSKAVPVTVQPVASKLMVTPNPAVIPQNGSVQLAAKLLDRADVAIPNTAFEFQSSHPHIATVSATGLVTSVGPAGSTNITVRSGQFATTIQVAITQVPTTLRVLAASPLRLAVGRSTRLSVVVLDATNVAIQGSVFRFTSLNPAIVGVAADGTITSVGPLGAGEVRVDVPGTSLTATIQLQVVTATSPTGMSVDSVSFSGGYAVALTANGERAVLAGPFRNAAASIDLQTRTASTMQGAYAAYGVAITRDQRTVYMATLNDGAVREFDLGAGTFTDIPIGDVGYGIALSPDGRFAYVGTQSSRLVVIELATRTVISRIVLSVAGLHVTVDATGHYAYVSWDSPVVEVDLTTRQAGRSFAVPAGHATALSPDGRTLYVGTETPAVYSVDLVTGTPTLLANTPECGAWGLGVTPDDRYLYLACSSAGRVDVLDIQSREIVAQHRGLKEPRRVAVSQDGATVVVARLNGLVIFR